MPQFLSDEWVTAAREIRSELEGKLPTSNTPIKLNLVVTGVPFGDNVEAHLDTTEGIDLELGHLDGVDATMTLTYETAKDIIVAGKVDMAVQAFMAGQLKIDGDLMKVMGLQTQLQNSDLDPLHEAFMKITD